MSIDNVIVPQVVNAAVPQRQVTPTPRTLSPGGAVEAPAKPGCPNLAKALAEARDRCKAAPKNSRNNFHNYDYASADTVIATASEALAGSGLALIPTFEEMVVLGSGSNAFFLLNRTLFLSHASGEYVPLEIRGWPVLPDKGRPLDKAYAMALTSSLSYKLRDLLQMPRGDQDDMSARNDNNATPDLPPQTANDHSQNGSPDPNSQPPAGTSAQPAMISPEQRQVLVGLAQQNRRTADEVSAMLMLVGCKVLDQLPANLVQWAATILTDGAITPEQCVRLNQLIQQQNLNMIAFNRRLQEKYAARTKEMLSRQQADEIIKALEAPRPAPQSAA